MSSATAWLVDSDNAMGSPFGDVDDGFAIAAFLNSNHRVIALSSVFGNTFEAWAYRNNRVLATHLKYRGRILRGASTYWAKTSETAKFLAQLQEPVKCLALGPLSNVALALRENPGCARWFDEIVVTGTNIGVQLPQNRFFDFNFWKDPRAAREVFASTIPLTLVPCNVARKLRLSSQDIRRISGPIGDYFRKQSRRWFLRASVLKLQSTVPIWDAVAALYVVDPSQFEVETIPAQISTNGKVTYGRGERMVRVVRSFDPERLRRRLLELLANYPD